LAKGEHVSTPTGGNALSTDFDLMRSVAGAIDTRNEEIRATLQSFIGRMSAVPQSVWGGMAASRFRDVVHRWNAESMKLHHALHSIAETIRYNEVTLRDAADNHAHHIGAAAGNL
jgi:WXG100 family type VII secretion target